MDCPRCGNYMEDDKTFFCADCRNGGDDRNVLNILLYRMFCLKKERTLIRGGNKEV